MKTSRITLKNPFRNSKIFKIYYIIYWCYLVFLLNLKRIKQRLFKLFYSKPITFFNFEESAAACHKSNYISFQHFVFVTFSKSVV